MLEALARNWHALLFRAVLAIAYGIAAFSWPALDIGGFVYLFGLYALFDGVAALAVAMDVSTMTGFGSLLFEALVRLGGGLVAMGEPAVIFAFPRVLAAWAVMTGVAEIILAVVLRRELARDWPLPVAGAISIGVGVLLLLPFANVGVPALRWLVGPYAMCFGALLLPFVRRMRQLNREIQAAHA